MSEFGYGLFGGMMGTLLSHPFDTIKTRIQTSRAVNITQAYKFGKLYSGIIPPFLGIGLEKSIVFGFYELAKKSGCNNFTSGLIGGFASTIIVVPVDQIKIILQNNQKLQKAMFVPSNLYKGFGITLFRETPGFGIYFTSYNYLITKFNKESSLVKSFIFGAVSGFNSWVFIYPVDLIKTRYQSIVNCDKTIDKSPSSVIKSIYNTSGIAGFYRGFNLAIMRALPLHGGVFLGYELIKKFDTNVDLFTSKY